MVDTSEGSIPKRQVDRFNIIATRYRGVSPQQLAPSPAVRNASLGAAGRLVDITGFGLLLTVLGKLYSATAAAAGPATIVG